MKGNPSGRADFQAPRGTRDILPDQIPLWERLDREARSLFRLHGFREIRPPLFEETSLFARSIGEATDIVEKEMFTVEREGSSYTFRPEGTAGVVRAYLEAGLHKTRPFQKLFYIGPMFRYERPQKGRERQFHQIGIETLGSLDPFLDAEAVHVAASFFERLGLGNLEVRINSMGDLQDRDRFREILRRFLAPRISQYCAQCRARFDRNVFRVLDCKVAADAARNREAPSIMECLGPETAAHFERVRSALGALGRAAAVDPRTVRGFDYYTRTVFEIHDPSLGARSALCGGGRYDGLIQSLGGPDLGAVGFAIGITGTLLALEDRGLAEGPGAEKVQVFVAAREDADRLQALEMAASLWKEGVSADFTHEDGRSLKSQLRAANGLGALVVLIASPTLVAVKSMGTGAQIDLPASEPRRVVDEVKRLLA